MISAARPVGEIFPEIPPNKFDVRVLLGYTRGGDATDQHSALVIGDKSCWRFVACLSGMIRCRTPEIAVLRLAQEAAAKSGFVARAEFGVVVGGGMSCDWPRMAGEAKLSHGGTKSRAWGAHHFLEIWCALGRER